MRFSLHKLATPVTRALAGLGGEGEARTLAEAEGEGAGAGFGEGCATVGAGAGAADIFCVMICRRSLAIVCKSCIF